MNKSLVEAAQPDKDTLPATITKSYLINGLRCDLCIQVFSDRIFVGFSQLGGKMGTFLMCSVEESIVDGSTTYHISPLLGKRDDPLLSVYARQLSERIATVEKSRHGYIGYDGSSPCPPILLGIALCRERGRDNDTFRKVLGLVVEMYADVTSMEYR